MQEQHKMQVQDSIPLLTATAVVAAAAAATILEQLHHQQHIHLQLNIEKRTSISFYKLSRGIKTTF